MGEVKAFIDELQKMTGSTSSDFEKGLLTVAIEKGLIISAEVVPGKSVTGFLCDECGAEILRCGNCRVIFNGGEDIFCPNEENKGHHIHKVCPISYNGGEKI